jgi:hypothetical protein
VSVTPLKELVERYVTEAELQGARFQFAAIPVTYPQLNSFDFRTSTMRSLFPTHDRKRQSSA